MMKKCCSGDEGHTDGTGGTDDSALDIPVSFYLVHQYSSWLDNARGDIILLKISFLSPDLIERALLATDVEAERKGKHVSR